MSHLERDVSLVRIPNVKTADLSLGDPQLWHELHKGLVLLDQSVVGRLQYFLCMSISRYDKGSVVMGENKTNRYRVENQ